MSGGSCLRRVAARPASAQHVHTCEPLPAPHCLAACTQPMCFPVVVENDGSTCCVRCKPGVHGGGGICYPWLHPRSLKVAALPAHP